MKYEIKYNEDAKWIDSKINGQLYLSDLPQFGSDLASLLKKYDCKRVLHDATEVDLKLSHSDFLEVPRLSRERDIKIDVKRAIVFARDTENWKFYEMVAANRGEYVKVFMNFNQAKEWLMG